MKKIICIILGCMICFVLTGCMSRLDDSTEVEAAAVVQVLADRSHAAKEFAIPLFTEYMQTQKIVDYTIEQISAGFETDEVNENIYMVGFLYRADGNTGKYGYKIRIDDNSICSVLDEGIEIAEFVFGD